MSRRRRLLALWRPALNLALAAGIFSGSACTRSYYRKKTDEEVSEILAQKDKYCDWKIENWHVYPDPRARFADSSDPDHPPMPPDDPAAHCLSPNPQNPGKAGIARIEGTGYLELIKQWDAENRQRQAHDDEEERQRSIEPPPAGDEQSEAGVSFGPEPPPAQGSAAHRSSLPPSGLSSDATPQNAHDAITEAKAPSLLDFEGHPTFLLTLDQAAELAMFNSREYQDQRENLYLAALPVTQERFSLAAQFFAASQAARNFAGTQAPGGAADNWTLNNGIGMAKVLPTGALLLANFANQTVFNITNPKKTTSVTSLDLSAIQPLLQGGGKAVALESLTEAERQLLYQIRDYARFRKELYVEIASQSGGSISGAAFQPTGVLSNNSTGINTLGNSGLAIGRAPTGATTIAGPIVPPTTPGALALGGAITPAPSGYLNTMLQKIQVYIDRENIDGLTNILQRFRGLLEGDVVGPLQVQTVEQQLLAGRFSLVADQQNYLQAINQFKLEIGVPMDLPIEMDNSVLRPLLAQFGRSRAIIDNERAAIIQANRLIALDMAPRVRAELLRIFESSALVRGTPFAKTIRKRWDDWVRLSNDELDGRLAALRSESKKLTDLADELQQKGQSLSKADAQRLREVNGLLDLATFERALRTYEINYVDMGKAKNPGVAGERQRIRQFQSVVTWWQKVLVEARDDQWTSVEASWPELPRCCVDGIDLINGDLAAANRAAGRHALENRLDLMNTRAQVTDAWRQVAVYANAMLGVFTVQYNADLSSPAGAAQPLNIGGNATSQSLVLNGQLPLSRIAQRNNYRASLIALQRQRRALQEAEDLAVQVVELEISNLRQFVEQYQIQKRQLQLAYLTIDSSLESLQAPASTAASRAAQDGPAALTQQLLAAQRSLPSAQTALLSLWISYLNARLQLYRDLELMPLDERGVWIDQIRDCDCGIGLSNVPVNAKLERVQGAPWELVPEANKRTK